MFFCGKYKLILYFHCQYLRRNMEGSWPQFKITIHACMYDCVYCTRCVMQVRWSGRQTSPPESIGKLWLCRLHSPSPQIIYRIGGRCRTITWSTVTMCWPRNPLVMPRTSEFFFSSNTHHASRSFEIEKDLIAHDYFLQSNFNSNHRFDRRENKI